jgi:RNA polymerase sigma-70 factor (ECF subfamily)
MPSADARLTQLYEKHNRAIHAYCLRRVDDDDAADAVAAVFAVAWRRVDDMPTGDMALPWLYGVARRVVSDHHRSQQRRRRLAERLSGVRAPSVPQPEWQVIQRAEYRQVHEALAAMRPKDREVLRLAAWEELSNESIAVVLGCSIEAAAQRLHRAKRRLGRTFRKLQDSPLDVRADGSETE